MNAVTFPPHAVDDARLDAAVRQACASIMPSWPLDQAVAVNPHWRRIDKPIGHVAARLAVLADFCVFPSRDYLRREWQAGRITRADLDVALGRRDGDGPDAQACMAALDAEPAVRRMPLPVDLLDDAQQKNTRWPWREAIVFQISQACAAYFDRHQADWRAAGDPSLYGFWRQSMVGDHGLASMLGVSGFAALRHDLPADADGAMRWAMAESGLPSEVWTDYFEALLLSINGWAAWCAYVGWQKVPDGGNDPRLRELLACRAAWEALLVRAAEPARRAAARVAMTRSWSGLAQRVADAEALMGVDEIWQQALEVGYQHELATTLRSPAGKGPDAVPEVQAVFCIDTRSERMRRALEAIWPAIETRAFAGFFGLPMHYNLLGTDIHRPQLPGLAYPDVAVRDTVTAPGQVQAADDVRSNAMRVTRWKRLGRLDQWLGTVRWPNATFSFVEMVGAGYLVNIAKWIRPPSTPRTSIDHLGVSSAQDACRPMLSGLDLDQRVTMAADILHTMGLDDRLAPLVVLCGHAGHTTNNAHASTLDCGACYGRSGEANARALALLLNDGAVRAGLRQRGLTIPEDTVFVAALHNTTTDEVGGFDLDLLPSAARDTWQRMETAFAQAGERMRRERADTLWMNPRRPARALLKAFRRRANDGSQTRPEWGLTRNAAFLIGPRARTRGRLLDRVFLHDYDARFDADGTVLEKLMMGPMLVTNWLSWQYHASTCDPLHYGAGNKVLHNVVDGHVGVFEGNGGDLRIGLPKQSLHDGEGWYHQPVRLTVVIDAPRAFIDAAIARNPVLGSLCDNGWMHLWRYEGDTLMRRAGDAWLALER